MELVHDCRQQIEKLWEEMQLGDEQRALFTCFHSGLPFDNDFFYYYYSIVGIFLFKCVQHTR